jgi:hypothetical protein
MNDKQNAHISEIDTKIISINSKIKSIVNVEAGNSANNSNNKGEIKGSKIVEWKEKQEKRI